MKRTIITLSSCFILQACQLAPIKEAGVYHPDMNGRAAEASLQRLVKQCWSKPVEGLMQSDAIYGVAKKEENQFIITLGRDNSDIPFLPFARIILVDKAQPSIIVEQGEVTFGSMYDVNKGVDDWFSSGEKCVPLSEYKISV